MVAMCSSSQYQFCTGWRAKQRNASIISDLQLPTDPISRQRSRHSPADLQCKAAVFVHNSLHNSIVVAADATEGVDGTLAFSANCVFDGSVPEARADTPSGSGAGADSRQLTTANRVTNKTKDEGFMVIVTWGSARLPISAVETRSKESGPTNTYCCLEHRAVRP